MAPDPEQGKSHVRSVVTPTRSVPRAGSPFDRAVDEAAREGFLQHHGRPDLGPVAVVIPAYNEAGTIARVLAELPEKVGNERVWPLVVVDGGTDETETAARQAGAYACLARPNRGQGAALRLGYSLATEHGAKLIATIDADGQYDAAGLEGVMAPLLDDTADFVTGSRKLGRNDTTDSVRKAGVVLFAAVISVLARQRITDPANGFRAMKAEVPASLNLSENQYQAAELLVGALLRGYRVREVPVTMRARASGSTKKGNNVVYGYNFARVIARTWSRER